jgi:hypothetical protein
MGSGATKELPGSLPRRKGDTEASSQVVAGARGDQSEGHSAASKSARRLTEGAIAPASHHEIYAFLGSLASQLLGLTRARGAREFDAPAGLGQHSRRLLSLPLAVTSSSYWIVKEKNSHRALPAR